MISRVLSCMRVDTTRCIGLLLYFDISFYDTMCIHYLRSLQCYLVVFLIVVFDSTFLLLPRLQCYFISIN